MTHTNTDLTTLKNKTVLVTGASAGIGKATAQALVDAGARVVVAARSVAKAQAAVDALKQRRPDATVSFVAVDLASLASVRAAAQTYLDSGADLDVLINNAGLAGARGLTQDGFEITVGTNHVGPYLLTKMLLPRLIAAPQGRIVNVASRAHYGARSIDFAAARATTASRTGINEYGVSKLMNVLHAKALARQLTHTRVTTYALHPGVVASEVWREVPAPLRALIKLFMINTEQGALTSLYCAADASLSHETGKYYDSQKQRRANPIADDLALQDALMQFSEDATRI